MWAEEKEIKKHQANFNNNGMPTSDSISDYSHFSEDPWRALN